MNRRLGLAAALVTSAILMSAAAGCRRHPEIRSSVERDQLRPVSEWLAMEPVRMLHDFVRIDTSSEGPGTPPGHELSRERPVHNVRCLVGALPSLRRTRRCPRRPAG